MSSFGPACVKCGHPATYHGRTFCSIKTGDGPPTLRRMCDCDGYDGTGASLLRKYAGLDSEST